MLLAVIMKLSKSGEGYFYTYQKVKEVLSENKTDAIFVEYSNNVLEDGMNEWIWGYEKMNAYFPWHSPFMDKTDILFLYHKNPKDFPKVVSTSTRSNFTRILSFDYSIVKRYGGYEKTMESNVVADGKDENATDRHPEKKQRLALEYLRYLKKIIDYCTDKNRKVYLVRSPQHKNISRSNEARLLRIKDEKFNNVEFLDFDKFPLQDDEYQDFGHLNYKGAKVFSQWFNELLKKGLLSKKNKSQFIASEIEKSRIRNKEH